MATINFALGMLIASAPITKMEKIPEHYGCTMVLYPSSLTTRTVADLRPPQAVAAAAVAASHAADRHAVVEGRAVAAALAARRGRRRRREGSRQEGGRKENRAWRAVGRRRRPQSSSATRTHTATRTPTRAASRSGRRSSSSFTSAPTRVSLYHISPTRSRRCCRARAGRVLPAAGALQPDDRPHDPRVDAARVRDRLLPPPRGDARPP